MLLERIEKGLSSSADVEGILGKANGLERKYKWLEASGLYEQALRLVDKGDLIRRGEVQEKICRCLHRSIFQAENREEFSERLGKAVEAYESAHGFYQRLPDNQGVPWMLRCRAISRDLSHWLASDPSEKRRLLDESLKLEEKALKAFWDRGDKLEYGRTYNQLALVHYNRYVLEWDRQIREGIFEKAIEWGDNAVAVLSELDEPKEIAIATCTVALYLSLFHDWHVAELERREQHRLKDIECLRKAVELSERVEDAYLVGLTHWNLGWIMGLEGTVQYFKKALECGYETRDIFLKGIAQDYLAFATYWIAHGTDDPDQRMRLAKEAMAFYDKGQQNLSLMSYFFRQKGIILAPGGYAEHYFTRARWETDREKKLEFLDKSEKAGLKALEVAEGSDLPTIIDRMCHFLSKTLTARATLEPDVDLKISILEKAMKYRERNIEIDERLYPLDYWNIGVWYSYLALIKSELANVESDLKSKRRLLEDAAFEMEKSLDTIYKIMPYNEKMGYLYEFASLSRFQDNYGEILTILYEETNEPEYLRKAIELSRKSIESASKLDMHSRISESYWKIAKAQNIIGERTKAAESFGHASESYEKAAEKIPQLRDFYNEYASYMQAWSEFEKAKQSHAEKRYLIAKEHYEKAAEYYKSTKRWSYLAPNYQAWAMLEKAEDLSREEQTEEAKGNFELATSLFLEAKNSIQANLERIEGEEEKEIAEKLVKASGVRCEYCHGRVALEDARVLDRQGDHSASSKRYGEAVEIFQGVMGSLERESDQKELRPIINLCKAWERMMMAEAQMSPSLYDEAASLFIEARDNSSDQTTRLLAQAHSSFCKALEAGTMFELTRGTDLFSEAKRHIEASTSYYLRAGHQTMSDYAGATSRFLDAYLYTYNAQTEADPKKRAQFYQMAERLLQSSAGAYLKAKHPEKSDEIRRILRRVKEEREIAVSLSEVLHTPSLVSTTASFSTPTPTHEQAVGLERFESADIQANLIAKRREVGVGEDMDLEIELVNAGKAPAQLIKVEEIIPEGFEVISAPDICRVEDSYLDMKGRTLNPLKTAELKIILKPLDKGTYELRPRVLYLDEAGKYRSHEPEPATVVVKELGIKGWIRGPTR